MTGSYQYPEQTPPQPYPEQVSPAPSAYPGTLPPPVPYPTRRRWPKILAATLAVVVLAGVLTAVLVAGRRGPAAQVLFTMRVAPASGSVRGQRPISDEQQGVAQLLVKRDGNDEQVLVCSYVLRTGGQY
ncbi:hypothetical protein BN970_04889 [Mycolicibacterium conceptionense]|uniref:DUF8174 domain-containing protein n=1 Tax=Mycolicibacterium conceptionense TaxID=451644 RepID=A0A0U1DQS1_9MYCO|nr:hypothetical protein BN970_04889 [Mycolicibacterium conceptionense]